MKRVVKTTPKSEVILLSEISDNDYVGIRWNSGAKSWIIKTSNKEFKGIEVGDRSLTGCWIRSTKKDYVGNALEQEGTKAYVFENKDELLTFLLGK